MYDRLIRVGRGRGVLFAVYDPCIHGAWELADINEKVLRPRFLTVADHVELENARRVASEKGLFDPSVDARRRIMAAIVQREDQRHSVGRF